MSRIPESHQRVDVRRADAPPPRRRWLARPYMTLALLVAWLALNQTVHPGHIVLGGALAWAIAQYAAPYFTEAGRPNLRVGLRLLVVVLFDIVIANLQVAVKILGPQSRLAPRFVWIPLELRRPEAITVLASIITLTPGTLSAELSDDRRHLLVHGLDVPDEQELIDTIKRRYEYPLKQLLE
ncbi:MAG TPA: Na+/H+ antiporter subunit E [Burkholderiaceae bacterium]|nr:Na+/H+ antiporter subunit E [Burkholderiaceae bacterium]